ncbi:MAG: ABC transporter substrate-binding protein [Nitrospinae bacterium]|nr:ABC transporter substrate-binding protein [Nitrospinota bacterium]
MKRFLMLVLLLAFIIDSPACTRRDEAEKPREQPTPITLEQPRGGIYRRPLGNDPTSLDPARITDYYAVTVANQVFDGLVEFDAHLNVLPALAQSWSASRDGLVWTFHLRQGVQFHNGRELVAGDVVYSLSRFLDPAIGSSRSWFLEKVQGAAEFQAGKTKEIEGIRAVDRYTLQIMLSEPFSPFISMLGLPHLSVVPREEVERSGPDFATAPVGTGPFRFVRWKRGHEIILASNERYFRGRPPLDRVKFVIFPGEARSAMLEAFERGELEETLIPPNRRKELLESSHYKVVRKPTLSLLLLGFNLERPPFDKLEVRQALNYAIDKVRINREIRGDMFVVARGILPPGMPGYNPEVQGYDYNPGRARELMAQGGHSEKKEVAPVALATSAKSAVARQDYEVVRQYLASIDVQLDLQALEDWPTFQRALQRGESQIFRYAWYADYPDADNFLYFLFHSATCQALPRGRAAHLERCTRGDVAALYV